VIVNRELDLRRAQDELPGDGKFIIPASTDEVLVAAAKSGDYQAFGELWTRHTSRVFKTTYRITGNREDAEDAMQDVWIKAHLHLRAFNGRAQFTTWLTRIAINTSLMILRKKRVRPETSMDIGDGDTWQHWEFADKTRNVEELYTRQERIERLKRAICRLQPILRHVLEIHQAENRSVKEVAELTGISVAATKSRLWRARKILRKTLS
jgi:RNA polymerase sigma-70 factor (ECF subfamily)